jgi:ribosomal protein S18 acetylase RimI-like enzyme
VSRVAGRTLELVDRLEAHAIRAWPPKVCVRSEDGWILRATPGLDRGRSNNALPPRRALTAAEMAGGIARVEAFAADHGIRPGITASPLPDQDDLLAELTGRGWTARPPVLVMAAGDGAAVAAGGRRLALTVTAHADASWLRAWAACDPTHDVTAHVDTVFRLMGGTARFARWGEDAVGIAVESDGLVGLFSLAVRAPLRRRGHGSALVRGLLAGCADGVIAYLQVEESNTPAVTMYEQLGFCTEYRYRHCERPALVGLLDGT